MIIICSKLIRLYYLENTIFWDITSCSLLKVSRHFIGTYLLHLQGWIINQARKQHESRSAYYLTLKMELICFSEMLVDFQWTTWRYIPEDSWPPLWSENLKSYVLLFIHIIYFSVLYRWRQQAHSEHHYSFTAYMYRRPQSSYSLLSEHQISQGINKFIN
jgi:hypothetical protein